MELLQAIVITQLSVTQHVCSGRHIEEEDIATLQRTLSHIATDL